MKATSVFIFAAGAAAGWAVAQRIQGDTQSLEKSYGQLSDEWEPAAAEVDAGADFIRPEPTRLTTRDPFRAAFQGAQAEIDSRTRQSDEAEEHVA